MGISKHIRLFKPTDKHFMVVVDESLTPYITFGDGLYGKKPAAGAKISDLTFTLHLVVMVMLSLVPLPQYHQ